MLDKAETPLSGLFVLTPRRFGDNRGFFSESWNRARMAEIGLDVDFVQDNHSLSRDVGTVRGLHFQAPPVAQDKLVRCGRGAIFDVAVDIRAGSATYGQWYGLELSHENGKQLFVPKGFLHGFQTLEADSEILYKCSDIYSPPDEGTVMWNDPDLAINWPIKTDAILSERDSAAPSFASFETPFGASP